MSISGSLVALEDLQSDRLELQSDGVFKGTLVTKIIGGTANVEMLMMPPMESEIVQDGEVVASKTVQIVKIDRQYTEQACPPPSSIPCGTCPMPGHFEPQADFPGGGIAALDSAEQRRFLLPAADA